MVSTEPDTASQDLLSWNHQPSFTGMGAGTELGQGWDRSQRAMVGEGAVLAQLF